MMLYKIDAFELLGLIKISDSSGSSIEENCIYLDSMFSALAEGLVNLQSNEECEINLIDETKPIIFSKADDELSISYNGAKIKVKYGEAIEELCQSYNKLCTLINEPAKVATFKELNQYIQTLCRIQF